MLKLTQDAARNVPHKTRSFDTDGHNSFWRSDASSPKMNTASTRPSWELRGPILQIEHDDVINGNISASLDICAGNSPVPGEFPAQRPVTRSFDVFFDLRLNKWLSKQSWGWWLETLSRPLWRHCNVQDIGDNNDRQGDMPYHNCALITTISVHMLNDIIFAPHVRISDTCTWWSTANGYR